MGKVSHDSETPAHGQQVITACAFIYKEFDGVPKVFLAKRADTKKFLPGVYELPGGHIEFGEDIEAGLKREIMEELGVHIKLKDPFAAFTYVNEVKGAHAVEVIYYAEFSDPIEQITLHPEDHSGYEWFDQEAVVARRKEIVPDGQVVHELEDDPEYMTILRGFKLLSTFTQAFSAGES